MPYTIHEHQHRLAAWAASTAASASRLCRFKVRHGVAILEACGFQPSFSNPNKLPAARGIDRKHRQWRSDIIENAKIYDLNFTDGVAAKLINCYLKARFVCGGHHDHERVKCLHPPIDEVLLMSLATVNLGGNAALWRRFRRLRWSRFDSDTYEMVISVVRTSLPPNEPLWKIEEFWKGHQ